MQWRRAVHSSHSALCALPIFRHVPRLVDVAGHAAAFASAALCGAAVSQAQHVLVVPCATSHCS